MITESERGRCWPGFLTFKDCNAIIKLCSRREIEKRYILKVQKLCKTFWFGRVGKGWLGDLNRKPLEDIFPRSM